MLFQVDNDAGLTAINVVADGGRRRRHYVVDDVTWLTCPSRCERFQLHRAEVISVAATTIDGSGSLDVGRIGALASPRAAAAAAVVDWIPLERDAAERIGESGLECVVRERIQKWIDGTVGVTQNGEELEHVHLVDSQWSAHAEHHVDLQQQWNTYIIIVVVIIIIISLLLYL